MPKRKIKESSDSVNKTPVEPIVEQHGAVRGAGANPQDNSANDIVDSVSAIIVQNAIDELSSVRPTTSQRESVPTVTPSDTTRKRSVKKGSIFKSEKRERNRSSSSSSSSNSSGSSSSSKSSSSEKKKKRKQRCVQFQDEQDTDLKNKIKYLENQLRTQQDAIVQERNDYEAFIESERKRYTDEIESERKRYKNHLMVDKKSQP
jgi:hypothetical protein